MVIVILVGCLGAGIEDDGADFDGGGSEADDDVACTPPAGSQGEDVGVIHELGVIPGLAVVMGVVLPEDVGGGLIEDVDLSAAGGDGAGTGAVRGDLGPDIELGGLAEVKRKGVRKGSSEGQSLLLVIEGITAAGPDAMHVPLAVEGDAMMVVGLRAFIDSRPGEAFNAGLVVIDLRLDVGEVVRLLLGGE